MYFRFKKEKLFLLKNNANLAEGASVPALGLSNKAVFDVDKQKEETPDDRVRIVEELYKEVYFNNVELNSKQRMINHTK